MADDPADAAYTAEAAKIAELQALLSLAADRLWELQADWEYLRQELVRCHAMLAALPAAEPSAGDPDSIWGDRLPK